MAKNKSQINQFDVVKRGGYDPIQVNHYVGNLQARIADLKKQLAESMDTAAENLANFQKDTEDKGISQNPGEILHDPEWAAVRVLGAAQEAADNIIVEAQKEAKERVAAYHRENKAEIEAQNAIYASQKEELNARLGEVSKIRQDLENEAAEMHEQSKLKMSIIVHAMSEINEIVSNSRVPESIPNASATSVPAGLTGAVPPLAGSTITETQKVQNAMTNMDNLSDFKTLSGADVDTGQKIDTGQKAAADKNLDFMKTDFMNPGDTGGSHPEPEAENSRDVGLMEAGQKTEAVSDIERESTETEAEETESPVFAASAVASDDGGIESVSANVLDPMLDTGNSRIEQNSQENRHPQENKRKSFFGTGARAEAPKGPKDSALTPEERQWARNILNSASEDFTHLTDS